MDVKGHYTDMYWMQIILKRLVVFKKHNKKLVDIGRSKIGCRVSEDLYLLVSCKLCQNYNVFLINASAENKLYNNSCIITSYSTRKNF